MTDPAFTHQVTDPAEVTSTMIDYEPDPKNSQHVRDRHLTDLADTIVQALADTPECWEIVKDGDGFNDHIRLRDSARIVVRRILLESV
jgi:hypothetical protein